MSKDGKKEYEYIDEYNGEDVRDDPHMLTEEKETFIHIKPKSDDEEESRKAVVESDNRGIIAGLLRHNYAEIIQLRKHDGHIVGGSFELPVGCLKIKGSKRKKEHLSLIVS